MTHAVATRRGSKLTDVRKSGLLCWLRPDGKTQVTIQYLQQADGSVEPQKIHTVVISTQHAGPLKATRCKEVAGYTVAPASSSSAAHRVTLGSRVGRSSLTRMEVGAPMEEVPSAARTPQRWTDRLHTSAGRWPSPL